MMFSRYNGWVDFYDFFRGGGGGGKKLNFKFNFNGGQKNDYLRGRGWGIFVDNFGVTFEFNNFNIFVWGDS